MWELIKIRIKTGAWGANTNGESAPARLTSRMLTMLSVSPRTFQTIAETQAKSAPRLMAKRTKGAVTAIDTSHTPALIPKNSGYSPSLTPSMKFMPMMRMMWSRVKACNSRKYFGPSNPII